MTGKPPELKPALAVHPEYREAVGMLNSIRVLAPDMSLDDAKTRDHRRAQFGKIKHILEGYEFCEARGIVIRVR